MTPRIKILDIFYGNQCDLTCDFCDTRSNIIRKKEFDPEIEDIKRGIILSKKNFDIENYSLLGGEPLLYKNKILEIVNFIRSIDQKNLIIITSNGNLIGRNIEFVANLISKYNVLILVSDHSSLFKDQTKSNQIKESVRKVVDKLELPEVNNHLFWTEIMNKRPEDDGWKKFWKKKNKIFPEEAHYFPEEKKVTQPIDDCYFWWGKSYGIFLQTQPSHLQHFQVVDGKPKPFNSDNIAESYFKGCPNCYSSFLYNKKLYKCAALGTLRNFLSKKNLLEDTDWEKYLSYAPLDLETCDYHQALKFSISKYNPIEECAMCPKKPKEILLTEKNTLPSYEKRN